MRQIAAAWGEAAGELASPSIRAPTFADSVCAHSWRAKCAPKQLTVPFVLALQECRRLAGLDSTVDTFAGPCHTDCSPGA